MCAQVLDNQRLVQEWATLQVHAIHTSFRVCLAALNPVLVLHVQTRDSFKTSEEDVVFQTIYNFDYSN